MSIAKLEDVEIYYETKGTGFPLVMINGYSGNLDGWDHIRPTTDTLAKHFQVITLDNRGTGRSSKPEGPYSIPKMADDVANLLDYLNIEKAHVLGESMGGMIAQEVALRHPEKVEKLVLVCTGPGGEAYDVSGQMEAIEKVSWMYNPPEGMGEEEIMDAIFDVAVYPDFLMSHREELMSPSSDYPTCAETLEKQYVGVCMHDTVDRLGEIKSKTLILHGADDLLLFPVGAELMRERIPDAELLLLDKTSHSIIEEQGLEVIHKIISFLE